MDDNVILRALMGAAGASVLAEIDLEKKRQEAEDLRKDRDHWKQARQDAHEAGELMRAELETLRKELDAAQAETVDVRRQRNNETDRLNATNAVSVQQRDEIAYLRARLDEERSVSAGLRQQLCAAQAAVTLQRAGIERLRAFVGKVRAARDEHNGLDRDARVEAALAALDADTEPTPVAERCPECDGSGMVDSGGFGPDGKAISVPCGGDCRGNPCPSQPAPVAETLDAEGGA